ncbi:MlaD family protein [Nocardia neocaledoniensis]|uniref:MlaD family protein n=1 Tax=Nocardia neocaledoniensis TaxID=236511 RepID=UPI002457F55A|nr:MlaD family protein [Nocardia neocaledoniensis]
MNPRAALSLSAIAAVLLLGVGYMSVGVLGFDPRQRFLAVEMDLATSGGLGPHAPVLLAGLRVGQIESVRKQAGGVRVRLSIDSRHRVPLASDVRIEQLSALGEPYLAFAPTSGDGPYLEDGQVVPADRIHAPTSITALSAKLVELLAQVRPEAIARLVDTFDRALTDTETAMRTLHRSSNLLAATLLSRTDLIRRLFADIQALGGDMAWLGPSLGAAGPKFGEFGVTLSAIVESGSALVESRPLTDYVTGDGLVPFLARLNDLIAEIGPSIAPLEQILGPVVTDAVYRAPAIDLSTLIDQALRSVDPDGTVRFRIAVR